MSVQMIWDTLKFNVAKLTKASSRTSLPSDKIAEEPCARKSLWHQMTAHGGHPERVFQIYRLGKTAAISNLTAALAMIYVIGDEWPYWAKLVWLFAILAKSMVQIYKGYNVDRINFRRISGRKVLHNAFFVGAFGLVWSPIIWTIFTMDHSVGGVWPIILILVLLMGAAVVYSTIPILCLTYLVSTLGPTAVLYLFGISQSTFLIPMTLFVFVFGLMVFSMTYSDIIAAAESKSDERARALNLLKQAHRDIHRLAERDSVTGLYNRRYLLDVLDKSITEAEGAEIEGDYGLYLLDLDHFKHINDAYGHQFGDKYLAKVGQLLTHAVFEVATVSRQGGDEFAVVTKEPMDRQSLMEIGEKMLRSLSGTISIDGVAVRLSASIGMSLAPSISTTSEEWLNFTDHALRSAKLSLRGSLQVFETSDKEQIHARNSLGSQLEQAIEKGEIVPWYQPQIDMKSGALIGFEALARWTSLSGTNVPPPVFFELAETRGIVLELSELIFSHVARDTETWRELGLDYGTISVNAHPTQLHHAERLQTALRNLAKGAGSPENVVLEVTEDCIIGRGTEDIPNFLRDIARTGCRISLDDFGTGYASLTHIRSLPIDEVKIDRKFIQHLEGSKADREIVRSILRIARLKNIEVVAEGVETKGQIDVLRREGCRAGQGYYFARPMPAADVANYIQRLSDWRDVSNQT